jgi:hypothetical protein
MHCTVVPGYGCVPLTVAARIVVHEKMLQVAVGGTRHPQ